MDKMKEKKYSQGLALMKDGDKCTKTSLFRWKPDWDQAMHYYGKAATAFKLAKAYEECMEANIKAAEANAKVDLPFSSAKHYEDAAKIAIEVDKEQAVNLFEQAAMMYMESGNGDRAADTYKQAAQQLIKEDSEKALYMFRQSIELYEAEDKARQAGQVYGSAIAMLISLNKLEDALQMLDAQVVLLQSQERGKHELWKAFLTLIIVHLKRDDYVAADRAYQDHLSIDGYLRTNESKAAGELLDAFEEMDADRLEDCVNKQVFTFLSNEATKLAKSLCVAGSKSKKGKKEKKKKVRKMPSGDSNPSEGSAGAGEESEEESSDDSEGLC